jgi:hypothetical protein
MHRSALGRAAAHHTVYAVLGHELERAHRTVVARWLAVDVDWPSGTTKTARLRTGTKPRARLQWRRSRRIGAPMNLASDDAEGQSRKQLSLSTH